MKKDNLKDTQKIRAPKYFKWQSCDGGSITDEKRNIIILDFKFTNDPNPYTIKLNKGVGYELFSDDDFERLAW